MAQATQCYYPCIDLAKFIFAFIVIGIHTSVFADYDQLDKLFAFITRFAVPFFFTASGFLYFQKPVTRTRWLHYIKRIGILYIIFSLLYFPIACFIEKKLSIEGYFFRTFVRGFNHLWYLYALILGISILTLLYHWVRPKKYIVLLAIIFYIFGWMLSTYFPIFNSITILSQIQSSITIRDVPFRTLCEAIPYLTIGMLLANLKKTLPLFHLIAGTTLFSVTLLAEMWFAMKIHTANTVMWLSLLPCLFFVFQWCMQNWFTHHDMSFFRKTSVFIYLIHPAIIAFLTPVFSKQGLLLFGVTSLIAWLLSFFILKASRKKYGHFLTYLM
ncbi:MAG: acyltransferase [Proteobacteria bacterium]|nr:acyltransferase [Pseudomonadota bacterium]